MTQPSDAWLQALGAQLSVATAPPGTQAPPMPPPAPVGTPSVSWLSKGGAALGIQPTAPAASDPFGLTANAPPPANDPFALSPGGPPPAPPPAPAAAQSPAPPPAAPPPAAAPAGPPPPPEPMPADVQFRAVGGGISPAHEASIRGPTQNEHLMASFEPPMQAASNVELRSAMQGARDEAVYENQARQAMERQEAAQRAQLQRQAELEALQQDYDEQVTQLGQAKVDDNRWWKKKGTGEKAAAIILSFLGGLSVMDPRGNGRNLAYEALMKEADNDLEAQKFDYAVKKDRAQASHNAFALALERYGSEDAAAGVARAATIDAYLAKVGQLQAQWKGVDASNYADDLRARLMAERERTIAAGIQFVPARAAPGKYQMVVRGQVIPGLVDEKKAQEIALEHGVKPSETIDTEMVKGGIQASIKNQELAAAAAKGDKTASVVLTNGETVMAPSEPEAKELRELVAQDHKIRRLIARATELRKEGFRANPGNKGELTSIQNQLRTAFSVSSKLGALSESDLKITDGAIGDLANPYSISSAPDRALESYGEMVSGAVRDRARTYQGAPAGARGDTSGAKSLKFHGGK